MAAVEPSDLRHHAAHLLLRQDLGDHVRFDNTGRTCLQRMLGILETDIRLLHASATNTWCRIAALLRVITARPAQPHWRPHRAPSRRLGIRKLFCHISVVLVGTGCIRAAANSTTIPTTAGRVHRIADGSNLGGNLCNLFLGGQLGGDLGAAEGRRPIDLNEVASCPVRRCSIDDLTIVVQQGVATLKASEHLQVERPESRNTDDLPGMPIDVGRVEDERKGVRCVEEVGTTLDLHPRALRHVPGPLLLGPGHGQRHGALGAEHAIGRHDGHGDVRFFGRPVATQRVPHLCPTL
mmetsp:Transcript_158203/g.507473  ORF Transcript_158203/g.507473 Transcript_158203/m.507473 type:complete len:294 (-) Transcript_158203:389-1270(-)